MTLLFTAHTTRQMVMSNCIFILLVALFLASPSQTPDDVAKATVSPGFTSPWKMVSGIHDRLIGRVLGHSIRPGMTGEQVDQIIGHLKVDRGQFGPGNGYWVGYSRYGLNISFARDDADPLRPWRVIRVGYWSLLRGD